MHAGAFFYKNKNKKQDKYSTNHYAEQHVYAFDTIVPFTCMYAYYKFTTCEKPREKNWKEIYWGIHWVREMISVSQ